MRIWQRAVLVASLGLGGCLADARIARMRLELADAARAGHSAETAALESRIDALAAEEYGRLAPAALRVRLGVAEDYAMWGLSDRALEMGRETLAELEQAYGVEDPRVTPALLSLAQMHQFAGQWSQSERLLDRAGGICRALHSRPGKELVRDPDCDSWARLDLPRMYSQAGAADKAVGEYQASEFLDTGPPSRQRAISMLTVYGRVHAETGAYPEAIWYLQRCVDESLPRYAQPVPSREKLWSSTSGDVEVVFLDSAHSFDSQAPRCLEDMIELRRKTGEDEAARRLAAVDRDLWSRGPDLEASLEKSMRFSDKAWNYDFLTSEEANNLAFFYLGKGRWADAARTYEYGIRLIDRGRAASGFPNGVYPAQRLIDELHGLAVACERLGRLADAEAAYRRAADVAAAQLHPRHRWRLDSIAGVARTLTAAGRAAESQAQWNRYLAVAEAIRGRDHADYAFGLAGLAQALRAAGRSAEADAADARADAIWAEYAQRVRAAHDLPLPAALRSPTPLAN